MAIKTSVTDTLLDEVACNNSICAVIVTYFPDDELISLLASVLPQVEALVVVDNSPENAQIQLQDLLSTTTNNIHLIKNDSNIGIAAAMNIGLETTIQLGCRWMLTLDQDTQCKSDMSDTLLHIHKTCNPTPSVVGSNYFDARNERMEVNESISTDWLERETVITSGSLIEASTAQQAGGFREEFFIDQVDHEFCLRMRAKGHVVVISRKSIMTHSVGMDGGPWLPVLGYLPNHSPLRKYYVSRNSIRLIIEYFWKEPEWCLRRLTRLLLGLLLAATLEKNRLAKIHAFINGFTDGIRSNMGPCRHDWIHKTEQN